MLPVNRLGDYVECLMLNEAGHTKKNARKETILFVSFKNGQRRFARSRRPDALFSTSLSWASFTISLISQRLSKYRSGDVSHLHLPCSRGREIRVFWCCGLSRIRLQSSWALLNLLPLPFDCEKCMPSFVNVFASVGNSSLGILGRLVAMSCLWKKDVMKFFNRKIFVWYQRI